jgi:hypothetical protein
LRLAQHHHPNHGIFMLPQNIESRYFFVTFIFYQLCPLSLEYCEIQ